MKYPVTSDEEYTTISQQNFWRPAGLSVTSPAARKSQHTPGFPLLSLAEVRTKKYAGSTKKMCKAQCRMATIPLNKNYRDEK